MIKLQYLGILNLRFKCQKVPTSNSFFHSIFVLEFTYFFHYKSYLFLPPCLIFKELVTYTFKVNSAVLSQVSILLPTIMQRNKLFLKLKLLYE
jgi:hypothetical protein